ncbi:MAG: LapA family protein [Acidobacteria bacterium]|nr:LapA family protein [Acidobacteriota bacterium]MCB9396532.1 LapA family protein [Acidobacteriota bacterium]
MKINKVSFYSGAVLLVLVLVLIVQNLDPVRVKFLFWTFTMSGALLLILVFLGGALLGWILNRYRRNRLAHSQQNPKVKSARESPRTA